ncbi:type II secretion system minor pseudopilin GspK [Sphingomonas jatrophae]|uniref:Type II secretion system protein K n=1 Tax=Sphingomonas jatrophae TaxID=1166337 RepID=A0A1I6JD10_9SPHN|nr:type II secretion system minor pseudopilin GspK [Sphingomonas jatrophae]SFR76915.1 general secretion pathway protein K [Sphingomonas jatrophae]
MTPRPGEEGAALLAVLMLVAVLGALTATALDRLGLATRLAANGAAAEQARGLALGAEALALTQVGRLADPRLDRTMAGDWTQRPYRIAVAGGAIVARMADGGNCFNLNSLVSGNAGLGLAARPVGAQQFSALMQALGVPQAEAEAVAAAATDWIDSDTAPLPLGAEDDAYNRLAVPYRTANTLMADPSELRAVAGVTPALYATLRPYLCALPVAELSPINVNTLEPDQAPLVAMLLPGVLTVGAARAILATRPPAGWSDASQFWAGPALGGQTPLGEVQAQTQVRTRYVRARLDVRVGGAEIEETVLIDARGTPARILARSWGEEA